MSDKCTICDIIQRKQKAAIVYEDDSFIAFLDIRPLFLGHSLLAPKQHVPTIYDFPPHHGSALLAATQLVGRAVTKAMQAEGTFIANNNTVSQSIDHLHIHIVPRKKGDGLKGFFWPRHKYQSEEELLNTQSLIKNEISRLA